MPTKTPYDNRAYRKRTAALKAHTKRTGQPCWLCGKPIDLNLPYTHPMSFTADHLDAIANGGKLLGEIKPAHRSCNSTRGRKRTQEQIKPPTTSRNW